MKLSLIFPFLCFFAMEASAAPPGGKLSTYTNPIIPGWNSDPSCVFVKEWDNTFFCTTSSFLAFPGAPVYASKDLVNWKHVSNALHAPEQLPELFTKGSQMEGLWAATLRFHKGTLYLITGYISWSGPCWCPKVLLFSTTNPYDDGGWKGPLHIENPGNDIDPDLFWDDDGKVYLSVAAGIWVSEIDLASGKSSEPFRVWNGTGDRNPEGPHIYKQFGYYYLLIGEGGTETNHSVTMARSKNIRGPYEGDEKNPVLTAKNTNNYFQTVGHADLFQDASGNWWAAALSTRSGPKWEVYPMGRETILVPVKWEEGGWPVFAPVQGKMQGPLPRENKNVPGRGPWHGAPDVIDFKPGSTLPKHFFTWRPQPYPEAFTVSPPEYRNSLRITPSRANLTGDDAFDSKTENLAFIARKQTSTVFDFSVDLSFNPKVSGEEAGISVFLTQFQHIDLSVVNLPAKKGANPVPTLRFQVEASGKPGLVVPEVKTQVIPREWLSRPIRLSVSSTRDNKYVFSAASEKSPRDSVRLGSAGADIVSGGTGPFTGTIVGAYATTNSGKGDTPAYFSQWRYTDLYQEIDEGVFLPAAKKEPTL